MTETNHKPWPEELRNTFITGLLILIPLYITTWIITLAFQLFDNAVPIIGKKFEGLGFIITIVFIFLLGFSAKNIIAKKILKYFEELLHKVPFVKDIYISAKHIVQAISTSTKSNNFNKVVLIEYPRKGLHSIGFLTKDDNSSITFNRQEACPNMVSVFVPTVPNPTTGFFVILPQEEVKVLDMSVEQGFKLVVSAGIMTPDTTTGKFSKN